MNKENYFKYYIQGSEHYLIPKDIFDELFDEMESWREEVKELKKQLEEKNNSQIFIDTQDMEERYAEGLYQEYLEEENQKYKKVIDKVSSQIKLYGKYDGEKCTRCFSMMTADFNKLLDILKEVE